MPKTPTHITDTTKTFRPILVSHADGSSYARPERDLGAGILNGMIYAQRVMNESISWVEISMVNANGVGTVTGKRVVVMPGDLSDKFEEAFNEFLYDSEAV